MFFWICQFVNKSLQNSFFWNVETSFVKEKNKNYTHILNFTSNQQTIIQNQHQNFRFLDLLHSQHCRKIYSFRFVSSISTNLFVTTTFNEFVTMIIKNVVFFFDFLHFRNQYITKKWIYYITTTIRKQMT